MRNSDFLHSRLSSIAGVHFPEIDLDLVAIHFGRRARTRLGSIRQLPGTKTSLITMNGLFADEAIPVGIVDATIAHELCHFVHGFSSHLPKLLDHPHRGGVVDKELQNRGLGGLLDYQQKWLKSTWPGIVRANFTPTHRRRRIVRRRIIRRSIFNYLGL
jgi:hypothetical protein